MPESASKNGWTRVAFGDVVRQVRDRVDPEDTDLERYVAGERMDTDDLRIRRWGLIGDGYLGPAFHMRFKPGHVLYGSRRTYLRKVAAPDFEGITANTTFVLESKNPKVLLPELLPFIMQAESFHEHSIKQSKGSVNPYVNFSDLTWYEFALPPLEEQRRIAYALTSAQQAMEMHLELKAQSATLLESINRHVYKEFSRTHKVSDFCAVNPESLSIGQLNSDEMWDYVDLSSVEFPIGISNTSPVQLRNAPSRARRVARACDILVSTVRPNLRGHTVVGVCRAPFVASTGFAVLRPARPEYCDPLYGLILSTAFLEHCQLLITGTAYPAVRPRDVAAFKVPYLPKLIGAGYGEIFRQAVCVLKSTWQRQIELQRVVLPCLRTEVLMP